jgi:hypothetical protein
LLVSMWALRQVNVKVFQSEQGVVEADTASVLAAAMD